MKKAFRIHESDNVATLLGDAAEENVQITGATIANPIYCCVAVGYGHKIAVMDIAAHSDVVKYGVAIGTAIQIIRAGEWVHLHNCRSHFDGRSGTLDLHTGSSRDVKYE